MTTQVIVSSPKPNHQNVRVVTRYVTEDGQDAGEHSAVLLQEGESTTSYVHSGMRLEITEVPK